MKAAQIKGYGGPDAIHIEDAPKPTPKSDQVLVEVYGASVNPFDYKIRSGMYKENMPLTFPMTVGGDLAGKIASIGENVTEFAVGDEVFGSANVLSGGSGSMAEYASANTKNLAKKPTTSSFLEASALPLVGSSAVQALEDHMGLQKGQKILIHGGAGGIGSIAIQLAKYIGAYVATTVGTDDVEFAKSLGADEVIDYKTQHFEEILHDFDAVYDTVGGETTKKSFQVLKKGGILVSMVGEPDTSLQQQYGVKGIGQGTKITTQHLSRVAELVDKGAIKPEIDKTFSLDHVVDAFTYQETSHPRGKVVIQVQ